MRLLSTFLRSIQGEPLGPKMLTSVPGPKGKELLERMSGVTDERHVEFFVDLAKSKGNYVVDADGNTILDCFSHVASLPLGYNHSAFLHASQSPEWSEAVCQRAALGSFPPIDYPDRLKDVLMDCAPPGMGMVQPMMCGSCSNENAIKTACMWFQNKARGGEPASKEDLTSCMRNEIPGSPDLSILSFNGAFHGRLLGCLSTTHSRPVHKLDVPAFKWPSVDFPRRRYPEHVYTEYNEMQEARSLEQVLSVFQNSPQPIAALITEPILSEGGDKHTSPQFFRSLREITRYHGAALIVDEVQTGAGATGTFWAHEQWGLGPDNGPDMVTFSKKMQLGGYYLHKDFLPDLPYRIYNTWLGDPLRLLQLEIFLRVMKEDRLLENVQATGKLLHEGLSRLASSSDFIENVRGVGTFLAFDAPSVPIRSAIVQKAKNKGLNLGVCGSNTIRFRPSLIFRAPHAVHALDILGSTLEEIQTEEK